MHKHAQHASHIWSWADLRGWHDVPCSCKLLLAAFGGSCAPGMQYTPVGYCFYEGGGLIAECSEATKCINTSRSVCMYIIYICMYVCGYGCYCHTDWERAVGSSFHHVHVVITCRLDHACIYVSRQVWCKNERHDQKLITPWPNMRSAAARAYAVNQHCCSLC